MCLPNRHRSSALSSRGHSRCWQGAKENAASASRGDGRSAKKRLYQHSHGQKPGHPKQARGWVGNDGWEEVLFYIEESGGDIETGTWKGQGIRLAEFGETMFQADGTVSAKALRPEHDSYVWGRARRPRGWK